MKDKRMHKLWICFSAVIFLLSMNACRTTGGSIGIDWGNETRYKPSYHPQHKYESKKNGPPAHAPAHGYRAKHNYRYYPNECVYYDTVKGAYFFWDNGGWQISVSLPHSIHLGADYVSLELDTDKPYRYNSEHKKKYPPGKTKNNKKKNKWTRR